MKAGSRRRFLRGALALAGLGLASGCGVVGLPWQPAKVRRIGFLSGGVPSTHTPNLDAFRQGLRDLGHFEGQNLLIEERYAEGANRQALAAELVRLEVDVIVVPAVADAVAAQAATSTIPIVCAGVGTGGDLVDRGLAANQARPGGNVTGLSTPLLIGKQLELFREAVPTLARVAVLLDETVPDLLSNLRDPYEAAARALGLQLQFVGAKRAEDLEPALEAAARGHANGLLVFGGPLAAPNLGQIAELAVRNRLPSLWQRTDAVSRGGLLAYAPNRVHLFRRAAIYVDKILRGARPADLPVEHPTTFDLAINLRTAQALGLTIPPSVLQQATEVIQ